MPRAPQFPSQGATLFVDLERRETTTAYTPLGVTRTLLGGRGANMYYLYRLLDESLSPLDPGIPMIFGSGLLTGLVPSAARGNCTSWSPESGVLLDANAGDYFPSFLRMNGFDHIVLYGKAPQWTLIMIREGVVTFEDAAPYAGMDNIDMRDAIARDTGGIWARNLAMVNITRAGENGVLTSGVMAGPKAIYARGGPGAKMGSLGLKGIVTIAQTKEFPTARPYKPYNRVIAQKLLATSVVKNALSITGTPFLYKPSRLLGAMGTKNNQETTWTEAPRRRAFRSVPSRDGRVLPLPGELPAAERSAQGDAGQVRQGRWSRVRDARQVRPEPRHRQRRVGDSPQQHLQRSRPRHRIDRIGAGVGVRALPARHHHDGGHRRHRARLGRRGDDRAAAVHDGGARGLRQRARRFHARGRAGTLSA